MNGKKLRIALVGCGQIADAHLQEVRKIASAELVGVCDRHLDLAKQAGARFGVPGIFDDLQQMLRTAAPDVLHVTTPPQSHAPIAIQALAAGVHLYIEKPFAVDVQEARQILDAAKSAGRMVCVGHDHLCDPVWERCRQLYLSGKLGEIVHVDSFQGYNLSGPFGRVFVSEPDHWLHRLPGGLFQNVMSHAMYRITEFLPDAEPEIWAHWFGEAEGGPSELRVMLKGRRTTANLVFSSTMRPVQRIARVYGTRQAIEADLDGGTIRAYRAAGMPGAFAKIEAPWRHLAEATRGFGRSVLKFLRSDIHYFAGMNTLFRRFYDSIQRGGDPPIPYGEIERITAIMDEIFRTCRRNSVVENREETTPSVREPLAMR